MTGRIAYEAFYAGLPKDTFEPWDKVRAGSQAIWARIERAVLADGERLRVALDRAYCAMDGATVFVTSRERIKRPEGDQWWAEEIAAARAALDGEAP